MAAALLLAWTLGGPTERLGSVLFLVGWLTTLLAQQAAGRFDPAWSLLIVDLAVLVGLGALAWKSQHPWPAWAAAFQSVAVALDLAAGTQLALPARIHLTASGVAGAGAVGALLLGTLRRGLRGKAKGGENDVD